MRQEIIERLAIAEQFSHNAQYAGVPRQAVADGYASVDAMFSAVLEDEGVVPPRNHRQKLEEVRRRAPAMFNEPASGAAPASPTWAGLTGPT